MPLNSISSFVSNNVFPVIQPIVMEPDIQFCGLSSAQCAALGMTSKAVTSTITLVEAGTARAKGMRLVVPTDQPQVTFGNAPATATNPIIAIAPNPAGGLNVTNSNTTGNSNGFAVPSGVAIFVGQFNDAMYAVTPTNVTATIYFADV